MELAKQQKWVRIGGAEVKTRWGNFEYKGFIVNKKLPYEIWELLKEKGIEYKYGYVSFK